MGDLLEKEIKRVVQVVEAYPDTGRRVFQTVLTEFEKFLEHYFKNENEASKKGVSLAAQVEQRETMAIQYTIELRKMLNDVPVQEGVRDFLFQVWADVLATAAVKAGSRRRDQGHEARRRRPDLVGEREGLARRAGRGDPSPAASAQDAARRHGGGRYPGAQAGRAHPAPQQLARRRLHGQGSGDLARASRRADGLASRRSRSCCPRPSDVDIDESLVMDLSGHESAELEVVGEGGSMPTPAMLSWARELQVGSWYMLDYRNRNEAVQLAWQGMRRQLTLFVSPQGRGVLFQQHRLAAFLQAGLLVPAQEEALTVRATRSAMAKLDGDPSRLLA